MTTVLAINSGHDGAVAGVQDGRLLFSLEAEKDSGPRHSTLTAGIVAQAMQLLPEPPDIVAVGGWHKHLPLFEAVEGAGYHGLGPGELRKGRLFGAPTRWYGSTHERSHVFCAAALTSEAPLKDAVVLVYEGTIGCLLRVVRSRQDAAPPPRDAGARREVRRRVRDRRPDLFRRPALPPSGGRRQAHGPRRRRRRTAMSP